ncbi:MAG: ABC transporter ATP-binding protein [Deltaproteobacteria bacterium]|nr:MAG: ABC transporter ATP-binding protein [Deltaproteobacteria bacterium]
MSAVISAQGVGRRFGKVDVLRDVNLEVAAGEVLALIGPNGGGKSTLLLLMAGLVAPTSGTLLVDGRPAETVALETTGTVGLITARPGFYPLLTGSENLAFFGGLFGLSAADVAAKAAAVAEELGITGSLDLPVGGYSSGMQQKLALVRALLMAPKVLLLDEPTANLDPVSAHTLYRTMRSRADQGLAVVVVTHDLAAVEQVCDRVAVVQGTVRHERALPGEKTVPAASGLLAVYQEHVEE